MEKSIEGNKRGMGEIRTGCAGKASERERADPENISSGSGDDARCSVSGSEKSFMPDTDTLLPVCSTRLVVSPTFRSAAEVVADMFELLLAQSSRGSAVCGVLNRCTATLAERHKKCIPPGRGGEFPRGAPAIEFECGRLGTLTNIALHIMLSR